MKSLHETLAEIICLLYEIPASIFWTNAWLGGVSFSVRSSRLYDLSVVKGESVFNMCQIGWGWTVRRGGGGGCCSRGRRCLQNLFYCFIMCL